MSFREGDVVVRNRAGFSMVARARIAKDAIGTVCRVVTLGSQYRVMFEDVGMCVAVFEDSIRLAPIGTDGPACTHDC